MIWEIFLYINHWAYFFFGTYRITIHLSGIPFKLHPPPKKIVRKLKASLLHSPSAVGTTSVTLALHSFVPWYSWWTVLVSRVCEYFTFCGRRILQIWIGRRLLRRKVILEHPGNPSVIVKAHVREWGTTGRQRKNWPWTLRSWDQSYLRR